MHAIEVVIVNYVSLILQKNILSSVGLVMTLEYAMALCSENFVRNATSVLPIAIFVSASSKRGDAEMSSSFRNYTYLEHRYIGRAQHRSTCN